MTRPSARGRSRGLFRITSRSHWPTKYCSASLRRAARCACCSTAKRTNWSSSSSRMPTPPPAAPLRLCRRPKNPRRKRASSGFPEPKHENGVNRWGVRCTSVLETTASAEAVLDQAIAALKSGDEALLSALNALPAPIYVTDAEGVIRYFNAACIDFAGRVPVVGQDRWCVTWKLYTELGDFLPHDQCPMAEAVKTQQQVRGVIAVAERPDGSRVTFQPYPTPLYAP